MAENMSEPVKAKIVKILKFISYIATAIAGFLGGTMVS